MGGLKTSVYRSIADVIEEQVCVGRVSTREISGENTSGVDIYLQLFDKASQAGVIADPTGMVFTPIRVPTGKRYDIIFTKDLYPNGFVFYNGLYIVASSDKYSYVPVLVDSIDYQIFYDENIVT